MCVRKNKGLILGLLLIFLSCIISQSFLYGADFLIIKKRDGVEEKIPVFNIKRLYFDTIPIIYTTIDTMVIKKRDGVEEKIITTLVNKIVFEDISYVSEKPESDIIINTYPNPTTKDFFIEIRVSSPGPVRLKIVNILGVVVEDQLIDFIFSGQAAIRWRSKDKISGNIYFLNVTYKDKIITKKIIILE